MRFILEVVQQSVQSAVAEMVYMLTNSPYGVNKFAHRNIMDSVPTTPAYAWSEHYFGAN